MSGPWGRGNKGTRLVVLRALAKAKGRVTVRDLAEQLYYSDHWLRETLKRPVKCGWVACYQPVQDGYGPQPRREYWITDKGRAHLASLAEQAEE